MEFDKLREVIAGILSVDPKEITEETTFLEDLGADSLDVYQIIMGIEDAFQIEIPAEKAEHIEPDTSNRNTRLDAGACS